MNRKLLLFSLILFLAINFGCTERHEDDLINISDIDNDGVEDSIDNCISGANPNQEDVDNDGIGDICDNCINDSNADQNDADNNGIGDVCDNPVVDTDNDGIPDASDNCATTSNPNQEDVDNDGVGDACDNCINTSNSNQNDSDNDGVGDACEITTYDGDVAPIINANCVSCHGGVTPQAGLSLTNYTEVFNAANNINNRMNNGGAPMPPSGLLPQSTRDVIQNWIDDGKPEN